MNELRGSFRDNPAGAALIVAMAWTTAATGFIAVMILLSSIFPGDPDIQWYPYVLMAFLAYIGWICWRVWQWLVKGREKPEWWGTDD